MRRFPPEAAHTGLNILLIRVVIRIPACGTLQRCKSQNVGQRQWRQTFINVFLVPGAEGHDLRNPLAQDVSAQINHQRFYVIGQGTVSFTFHKFWATCRELFLLTGCWTCRCWKDLLPWKLGAFLAGGFSCFFKSISWWFVCRGLTYPHKFWATCRELLLLPGLLERGLVRKIFWLESWGLSWLFDFSLPNSNSEVFIWLIGQENFLSCSFVSCWFFVWLVSCSWLRKENSHLLLNLWSYWLASCLYPLAQERLPGNCFPYQASSHCFVSKRRSPFVN